MVAKARATPIPEMNIQIPTQTGSLSLIKIISPPSTTTPSCLVSALGDLALWPNTNAPTTEPTESMASTNPAPAFPTDATAAISRAEKEPTNNKFTTIITRTSGMRRTLPIFFVDLGIGAP